MHAPHLRIPQPGCRDSRRRCRPVPLGDLEDELAERNITIVEDAAHAFGSCQGPARVGATGRATCFSFGPIKNLTCGQGGALVPRTREEADQARRIRLLGIAESAARRQNTTTYRVTGPGLRGPPLPDQRRDRPRSTPVLPGRPAPGALPVAHLRPSPE